MRYINDGSNNPPSLKIYLKTGNLQLLPKFPRDKEWTLEEKRAKTIQGGYEGLQGGLEELAWCRQNGLGFTTSTDIRRPLDADAKIKDTLLMEPEAVTVHLGSGFESDAEALELIHSVLEAERKFKIPIFVETHRATVTQDPWRTVQFIKKYP